MPPPLRPRSADPTQVRPRQRPGWAFLQLAIPISAGTHALLLAILLVGIRILPVAKPDQPAQVEVMLGGGGQPAPPATATPPGPPPTPPRQTPQPEPVPKPSSVDPPTPPPSAKGEVAAGTETPSPAARQTQAAPTKSAPPTPDASEPQIRLGGADPGPMADLLNPGKIIRPATAEQGNLPPVYPADSVRDSEEGTVTLRLRVDASGEVIQTEVAASSGFPKLDQAALAQIGGWRFRPAEQDGRPVDSTLEMAIAFRLK